MLIVRASTVKSKDNSANAESVKTSAQPSPTTNKTEPPGGEAVAASGSQTTTPTTPQTAQAQKVFYLICGFCRWTTRDAGIPDATISVLK